MRVADIKKGMTLCRYERAFEHEGFVLVQVRVTLLGKHFIGWEKLNRKGEPRSRTLKTKLYGSNPVIGYWTDAQTAKQMLVKGCNEALHQATRAVIERERLLELAKGL